jgi:hypothetical protein
MAGQDGRIKPMTTDTNNNTEAAPLPVCPICGKSSGFAKGFGRIITTHFRVDGDRVFHEGAIDQPRFPLEGVDMEKHLGRTARWWHYLKVDIGNNGLDEELKEAAEYNRPLDGRSPKRDIIENYLESINIRGALACDFADCRKKLEYEMRKALGIEYGDKPKKK